MALSLNPRHHSNHFEVKVHNPFANVQQGDISEEAKALRVDAKLGVLVKFNHTKLKGYVHVSIRGIQCSSIGNVLLNVFSQILSCMFLLEII